MNKNGSKYNIILINPPVYDFTYYNLWEKPLGLLNIAAFFKNDKRCNIHFIDCVCEKFAKKSEYERGAGKVNGAVTGKPGVFKGVKRNFHRFGIPAEELIKRLAEIAGRLDPDSPTAIFITCMMTYWYAGAFEAGEIAKKLFPKAVIAIGGIYARLMPSHAANSNIFNYVETSGDPSFIFKKTLKLLNIRETEYSFAAKDFIPAYEIMSELNNSVALCTAEGCPHKCTYCASNILYPEYRRKSPEGIINELTYYRDSLKVKNAAFYDDALLYKKEEHFYIWCEKWIKSGAGLNFHLPNAVHAAMIDDKCATMLKEAGFKTLRLGYEFFDEMLQKKSGGKINGTAMEKAIKNLLSAGFSQNEIGVYILFGHPEGSFLEAKKAANFIIECGATPNLTLFSPIPGTPDAEAIFQKWPQLLEEPMLQNKASFFELYSQITYEQYYELKSSIQKELSRQHHAAPAA